MSRFFTDKQLEEIVLVLENEASFYRAYMTSSVNQPAAARALLARQVRKHLVAFDETIRAAVHANHIEAWRADREVMRRYFDERYDIKGRENEGDDHYAGIRIPSPWSTPVKEKEKKPMHETYICQLTQEHRDWAVEHLAPMKHLIARRNDSGDMREGILAALKDQIKSLECAPPNGWRADREVIRRRLLLLWGGANEDPSDYYAGRRLMSVPSEFTPNFTNVRAEFDALIKSTPQPTKEEPTMSATNANAIIEVTTKTLVNGQDVATMSDSSIYELIAAQEAKIAELDAIKTKPKKLVAEIEKRQAGIVALVTYLDSKE